MASLLDVRDLTVAFDGEGRRVSVIDGVSFSVERGEILGVVGESGAGKSITGLAIIGLLQPPARIVAGTIHLDGERIDNLPPRRMRRILGRRIGAIFQDPLTSLNPLYTVGQQLVETITTHLDMSRTEARRRAVQLLADVGIPAPDQRLGSYPHEFSGGMRQRVVIALALACEPELVIADEPTTALDVSIQAQILALIHRLSRERGTAVVLVSHDMGVIAETTSRVAVMYAGRIVELGPTAEVVRRPSHPYTAGLMRSIPALGTRVDRLPQIEGSMPRPDAVPPGCRFHPRCPDVMPACRQSDPPAAEVGPSLVHCHLYGEKERPRA